MTVYGRYRNRASPGGVGTRSINDNGVVTSSIIALPGSSEQCYDNVVERFHQRSAAGEIFNSPFLKSGTIWAFSDTYSATYRNVVNGYTYTSAFNRALLHDLIQSDEWQGTPVSLDTENAAAKARIDALANINSSDVDALAFAGEWSKTKRLHRDLGEALLKLFTGGVKATTRRASYRKLPVFDRNGNPVLNRQGRPVYRYAHDAGEPTFRGKSLPQRMSDVYLVGRYGVSPLLGDLENAVKFLGRKFHPRFTARGFASLQSVTSVVKTLVDWHGFWSVAIRNLRTWERRVGILYETDPYTRRLAQLGLTRPLSSAWELLPWSFVADWFLEVGRYLDALQPAGFYKTLCSWESTRDTTVTTWEVLGWTRTAPDYSPDSWSGTWNGGATRSVAVKQRDPWYPALPARPALGQGFNDLRSLDFAALMLQKMRARF